MIQRVALTGGAPIELAEAAVPQGASWAEGTIFYGATGGVFRVAAAGGSAAELVVEVEDNEQAHGPQLLPGGEWLLFSLRSVETSWDDASIFVQSLVTGDRHELVSGGSDARYLPSGHIVYGRGGSLIAIAFDPSTLETSGETTSVVEGVQGARGAGTGAWQFAVSDTGSLIYSLGGAGGAADETLVWVDTDGNEEPLGAPAADYRWARVSPDGAKVAATAVAVGTQDYGDIHIYDVASDGFERRTYGGRDLAPVWSPDGAQIAFATVSSGTGDRDIHVTPSDGSGEPAANPSRAKSPVPNSTARVCCIVFPQIRYNEKRWSITTSAP